MKLNNLEVESTVLKYEIKRLEEKQNEAKIRPILMVTGGRGVGRNIQYSTVQFLTDANGCTIAENEGWDYDCKLKYTEAVLNYIVNFKEFYDIDAVIKASDDSKKTRAFFEYKGIL